ncbi:MAG: hypothetical protein O7E57_02800 [Gammaproteobacteria bacterium]|nr:hypothetical protein [Gammaproteobacteria bacterium]
MSSPLSVLQFGQKCCEWHLPVGIYDHQGAFQLGHLRVVCSAGEGWEHVSVSTETRCPTWGEMCKIKRIFRDAEDCVIDYHPPESTYVNYHPYFLHMWRPIGVTVPLPDPHMVGPKLARSAGAV